MEGVCEEFTNISLLNRIAVNNIPHLIYEVIDEICGGKQVTADKYDVKWSDNEWINLIKDLKRFILLFARSSELFPTIQSVDDSIKQQIEKCVSIKREDLHRHLIKETCAISENSLKDFDWTAKFVLASDSMATLKCPLLTLDLELQGVKDMKVISLELTKEELQKVISTLENVQKAMRELNV